MQERELFVFCGQSNMMGACVYPPSEQVVFARSFEYLHKPKRLGQKSGAFKNNAYPCGEFSYKDMDRAYAKGMAFDGKSVLTDYAENTYFCPSMSGLRSEQEKTFFLCTHFSETTFQPAPTLAPYVTQQWEGLNRRCAYAHIAKGGVSINYYFNGEMIARLNEKIKDYNQKSGENLPLQEVGKNAAGAGEYFAQKVKDFFEDAAARFVGESLKTKCFFWLQGEGDAWRPKALYKLYLETLWETLKTLGFTHFFCMRVDYWGDDRIVQIMKAQEEFCAETADAYMLTRVCSYMPMPNQDLVKWYGEEDVTPFLECRDSYFGFGNHHINEKGFKTIANAAVNNMKKILLDHVSPQLEDEKCVMLKESD
ncbi:MAG: hypothetical protein J6A63_03655 [Clostridia bacterium]|nr:hypothetical protein [Clostridia bacterium]